MIPKKRYLLDRGSVFHCHVSLVGLRRICQRIDLPHADQLLWFDLQFTLAMQATFPQDALYPLFHIASCILSERSIPILEQKLVATG